MAQTLFVDPEALGKKVDTILRVPQALRVQAFVWPSTVMGYAGWGLPFMASLLKYVISCVGSRCQKPKKP